MEAPLPQAPDRGPPSRVDNLWALSRVSRRPACVLSETRRGAFRKEIPLNLHTGFDQPLLGLLRLSS
jgi:hypothetical protein